MAKPKQSPIPRVLEQAVFVSPHPNGEPPTLQLMDPEIAELLLAKVRSVGELAAYFVIDIEVDPEKISKAVEEANRATQANQTKSAKQAKGASKNGL